MNGQTAIQSLLQRKLTELQAKNPAYSLRAFAKKLGIGSSTVSMVLNGERAASLKLARKICDALMLDPQDRSQLLAHFPDRSHYRKQLAGAVTGEVLGPNYLQLSADQFSLIGEWHYYGILSLIKIAGFRNDPKWIAGRLGIGAQDAEVAIDRMKRLGILVENEKGKLTRQANQYRTTDDLADISVRKSHFQTLDLARESLEQDPVNERDFTHLTLPVDPAFMPEIKLKIRQFQDELDSYLESRDGRPTEVYRLSCQFFPLSRSKNPNVRKKEK